MTGRIDMMMRRLTLVAAGLAMAGCVGLTGPGVASAATPKPAPAASLGTFHLTPGQWTLEITGGGCEIDNISSDGTFSSPEYGDSGYWAGGRNTVAMAWTAGANTRLILVGSYVPTRVEYRGTLGGASLGQHAKLVQGAVSGC
jgi:hypothetical protein